MEKEKEIDAIDEIDNEIELQQKEDSFNADEYRDYFFSLKRAGRIYQLKAKEEARLEEFKDK